MILMAQQAELQKPSVQTLQNTSITFDNIFLEQNFKDFLKFNNISLGEAKTALAARWNTIQNFCQSVSAQSTGVDSKGNYVAKDKSMILSNTYKTTPKTVALVAAMVSVFMEKHQWEKNFGLDFFDLTAILVHESRLCPTAKNPNTNAYGLGQIMKSTYKDVQEFSDSTSSWFEKKVSESPLSTPIDKSPVYEQSNFEKGVTYFFLTIARKLFISYTVARKYGKDAKMSGRKRNIWYSGVSGANPNSYLLSKAQFSIFLDDYYNPGGKKVNYSKNISSIAKYLRDGSKAPSKAPVVVEEKTIDSYAQQNSKQSPKQSSDSKRLIEYFRLSNEQKEMFARISNSNLQIFGLVSLDEAQGDVLSYALLKVFWRAYSPNNADNSVYTNLTRDAFISLGINEEAKLSAYMQINLVPNNSADWFCRKIAQGNSELKLLLDEACSEFGFDEAQKNKLYSSIISYAQTYVPAKFDDFSQENK